MIRIASIQRCWRQGAAILLITASWLGVAWGATPAGEAGGSVKKVGVAMALAQLLPLLHMLITDKLLSCYKAGYCMMYTAIAALSWISVLLIVEFFPHVPLLYVVGMLLSPYLFWLYAFTMGQRQKNQDFTYCKVKLKKH